MDSSESSSSVMIIEEEQEPEPEEEEESSAVSQNHNNNNSNHSSQSENQESAQNPGAFQCKIPKDKFCFICGEMIVKRRRHISSLLRTSYELFFGMPMANLCEDWTPDGACATCERMLIDWYRGRKRTLTIAVPQLWHYEPVDHETDCYFCLTPPYFKFFRKNERKKALKEGRHGGYPSGLGSCTRPVLWRDSGRTIPESPRVPFKPKTRVDESLHIDDDDEDSLDDTQAADPYAPKLFMPDDVERLLEDIGPLSAVKQNILRTCLAERNLLYVRRSHRNSRGPGGGRGSRKRYLNSTPSGELLECLKTVDARVRWLEEEDEEEKISEDEIQEEEEEGGHDPEEEAPAHSNGINQNPATDEILIPEESHDGNSSSATSTARSLTRSLRSNNTSKASTSAPTTTRKRTSFRNRFFGDSDSDNEFEVRHKNRRKDDDPEFGVRRRDLLDAFEVPADERKDTRYRIREQSLICPIGGCGQVWEDEGLLDRHLLDSHFMKKYRCLAMGCAESFDVLSEFKYHRDHAHQEIIQWRCGHCSSILKSYKCLTAHFDRHHQFGHFGCAYPDCTFEFTNTNRYAVIRHTNRVHLVGEYPCPHPGCGRVFPNKLNLGSHVKTHDPTSRKVQCHYCEKRFRSPSDLERHERVHTGEQPFQCGHCGKFFREKGSMGKHIKGQHPGMPLTFTVIGNARS